MFLALASGDVITQITRYLDLAGVFSCAMLGGAVARTEGLDLFGFLVVGIVSGLGGGIIRDTLLQHGTPVALTDYAYVPTAVAGVLLAFVVAISEQTWNRLFVALDAAVIGFWAVSGAQKTLAVGLGWLPALLLGITTAVGGVRYVMSCCGGCRLCSAAMGSTRRSPRWWRPRWCCAPTQAPRSPGSCWALCVLWFCALPPCDSTGACPTAWTGNHAPGSPRSPHAGSGVATNLKRPPVRSRTGEPFEGTP